MSSEAFVEYLERQGFRVVLEDGLHYLLEKANPGSPSATIRKNPTLPPEYVRRVARHLGVPSPV
jgi:predicted RNA binding protein YcfA (HicA-like mRNA interferase family)